MILKMWEKYSKLPFGKKLFALFIRRFIPYTGTIRPMVQELRAGHAVVQIADRRIVRNHLKSIHAVALMNIGELASGLAVISGIPDSMRGILANYEIEFIKKARGTLTATCDHPPSDSPTKRTETATAEVKDEAGDIVCRVRSKWLIGPVKVK